ncbi:hypothetical protein K5P26_02100 [Sphingopyxis sp. XHP0097]|uniref:Uncharacterized protein n=1 Tax=Sphingopyxis jiangsuensis TaxID=2871171 RepID=A0ABS7MA86_9SPHN|nr:MULTISPECIES: hypothetical protein [Sphingopyxis]MBY4635930.1 hypothetical protein [Sphingopyxis jiangsuensis]
MNPVHRALLWSVALMGVAVASIFERVPTDLANTLIIVLPALMIATTPRAARCCSLRAKA